MKIEAGYPKGLVVDPHTRKPFAMGWFMVTPQNDIVFFKEWPITPFYDTTNSMSVPQYAELIKREEEGIPGGSSSVVWRILDPNYGRTNTVYTGRTLEEEFDNEGLVFDCQVDNDIETGHLAVRRRLMYDKKKPISTTNRPTLFFGHHLKNFTQAFLHYQYVDPSRRTDRDPKESPKEKWKDFVDLVRYVCMYDPQYYQLEDEFIYHKEWEQMVEKGSRIY